MSGYATYQRWQRIEHQAKSLGFRLGNPRHGHWGGADGTDMVSLYPDYEALPIYSRDAEIWTGTFRDCEIFMSGWVKSQSYDQMLRMTDDKRRKKFEDAERARQAEQRKREEQKKMMAVLRATDLENLNPKE